MKKKSLTYKLVVTMTLIVAGTILFSWFLNNTFLEKIYETNKQKELISAYQFVSSAYEQNDLASDSFLLEFQRICTNENLDIIVMSGSSVVLSSANDIQRIMQMLTDIVNGLNNGIYHNEVFEADNYFVTRQMDEQMEEEYLILYGATGNKGGVYMRTPIKSMKESASITSMFLGITGISALFISVIVIVILSRSISRPIRELSEISKEMTDLHFEARYDSKRSSSKEIDDLGNNINILSGTLEKTISELKSANIELLNDIEKKEQIDEMRKEFLSNVSHELKTPLALIQGYAEGLQEGIDADKQSRDFYCEVIIDEAEKMNLMVKKLLTLNQLEFGSNVLDMSRFDLCELVSGIISTSALLADNEGITVNHRNIGPVYVWGDEFMIEDVITNYISNAIHYAKGEKIITVSYDRYDDIVRLNIHNTGEPIPDEEIDKIWDKFYKIDKARTREYGGNGIGLSIVKAIMKLHNHQYGMENCDSGVKFWIELETNY